MPVLAAPLPNRRVRFGKAWVRSQVRGRYHAASGQVRAMNPVAADKRLRYFRSDLHRSAPIQIQSHVAPRARKSCRANERPNLAASRRNKLRELALHHATAHHRRVNQLNVYQADVVAHRAGGRWNGLTEVRPKTALAQRGAIGPARFIDAESTRVGADRARSLATCCGQGETRTGPTVALFSPKPRHISG